VISRTAKRLVWGLDVASSAVKGVLMGRRDRRVSIEDADIVPLEGTPPSSDIPGRDRRIWRALQRFGARHDLTNADVIVGIPGTLFFTRPFNVLRVGTSQEAELIRFELEQHMPFGLDAVLWDYQKFPPSGDGREIQGLLFAMKKDVLTNYLLSLDAASIKPREIQSAPLALYNFVRHEMSPAEPTLVLDVGSASVTLLALDGPRYWVRTLALGSDLLTEAVRQAFAPRQVSQEEAEIIKLNLPRITQRGRVAAAMTLPLRALVGKVRTAVDHLAREHGLSFRRLILLGGGSQMYGLGRLLSEELGLAGATPAGLGRISVPDGRLAAYVNRELPSLSTAIGLGLQGLGEARTAVNVIGAALERRRSEALLKRAAAVAVIVCGMLACLVGGFSEWRTARLEAATAELGDHVGPLSARYSQWKALNRPSDAERMLERLAVLGRRRNAYLDVMEKFARMLPENERSNLPTREKVWLLRLDLRQPEVDKPTLLGQVEAAAELRRDGTHLDFLDRTIVVPLRNDERQRFRNIEVQDALRVADLPREDRGGGPQRYLVLPVGFQVALEEAQSP